jgi:hypothetical protein
LVAVCFSSFDWHRESVFFGAATPRHTVTTPRTIEPRFAIFEGLFPNNVGLTTYTYLFDRHTCFD